MRIAVTGGGGFLGKSIVRQLLERRDDVVVVARGSYPKLQSWGATQVRGDLADPKTALQAFKGCDGVIHCAAKAGIWGPRDDFYQANVVATQNVVDACLENGVPRLVYTSSPSVTFSGNDECEAPRTLPYPNTFLAHYPETKATAELIVLAANSDSLATTALRPHLIWGVGDPHLIPRLVKSHTQNRLKIVGHGENLVDMTHVENAAHAHLLALDQLVSASSKIAGKAYFISDDQPVKMWEWLNNLFVDIGKQPIASKISPHIAYLAGAAAETLWRVFKKKGEPPMTRFVAKQLSTSHWYDMGPAKEDLGYYPIVNPDKAYFDLVHWLKSEFPA